MKLIDDMQKDQEPFDIDNIISELNKDSLTSKRLNILLERCLYHGYSDIVIFVLQKILNFEFPVLNNKPRQEYSDIKVLVKSDIYTYSVAFKIL